MATKSKCYSNQRAFSRWERVIFCLEIDRITELMLSEPDLERFQVPFAVQTPLIAIKRLLQFVPRGGVIVQ